MSGVNVESGGSLYISQNCSVNDMTIGGYAVFHSSQCNATNVTVANGGTLYLSRYNNATSVTVEAGGSFHVASGASAFAVSSATDAIVTSESGAYIEFLTTEESESE